MCQQLGPSLPGHVLWIVGFGWARSGRRQGPRQGPHCPPGPRGDSRAEGACAATARVLLSSDNLVFGTRNIQTTFSVSWGQGRKQMRAKARAAVPSRAQGRFKSRGPQRPPGSRALHGAIAPSYHLPHDSCLMSYVWLKVKQHACFPVSLQYQ